MLLGSYQTYAPAKVLQAFQGDHHKSALRAKTAILTAITWNVSSMVNLPVRLKLLPKDLAAREERIGRLTSV